MTITQQKPPHRPYSRIRGKREKSVTEILSHMGIPGLPWGAAKETALFAVHHQDQWINLATDKAVDRLRMHHRGVWDGRASMGTATHAVMESWVDGTTVDLRQLVYDMAANDRQAKSWVGVEDQKVKELTGYVDGLEKFWLDFAPTDIDSEAVVRRPGLAIGQRDIVCTIKGQRWLCDIKTTATLDADKAIYGDSWRLQMVGYNRCPEVVYYGYDEKNKLVETGTAPNEPAERCGIIHLRGTNDYTFFEVEADDAAEKVFVGLAEMVQWLDTLQSPLAVAP